MKLDEIIKYLMEYFKIVKNHLKQSAKLKLEINEKVGNNVVDKSADKEDEVVSPCLDDKSMYLGFGVSSRFLRASEQKNSEST